MYEGNIAEYNAMLAAGYIAPIHDWSGALTNYSKVPAYYITLLGTTASSSIYQIDAVGYGGSSGTVAIVESTYVVSSNIPQDPTQP